MMQWLRVIQRARAASCCSAALLLSLFASSGAGAGTPDEAIRAAYATLQTAMLKNDGAAIASLLATNFQSRQIDGTTDDRKAYIKDQTGTDPGVTIASVTIAVTKLDVTGDTAQAEVQYAITGTYTAQGVAKPLRGTELLTDRWTLEGGRWKLLSSTAHEMLSYVDGKLVQDQHEKLPDPPPTSAAIAELRARAVVIPTLALSAGPQQLSAIGAAIGDARIVGMGEGSHGSSEFFAFKNRLFKYLVENKGFTVFAMEAAWGAGHVVDRYIKGGPGTAQQAVAALEFWTWNTPEVVDLVQWMRDYNARPGQHPILSFAGVDMQDPLGAAGYLVDFLRAHDAAIAQKAQAAMTCVDDNVSTQLLQAPRTASIADCRQRVSTLSDQLAKLGDKPGAEDARDALTNVLQYLDEQTASTVVEQGPLRDRDMAENLAWLATKKYPHAKIALWAHNFHVGAGTGAEISTPAHRPMGSYLRERFGADYYTIGQTFGGGTIRAIVKGHGLQSVAISPQPGDSIAALFGPLDAIAFLDLRGLTSGSALESYFAQERGIEQIGSMAIEGMDGRVQMLVPAAYDGLVYVPTSTASTNGAHPAQWRREITENGLPWEVTGDGFDEVTISQIADGAALSNGDEFNAMPNNLLQRFDATPYHGRTIRVSGEARRSNLVGFAFPWVQAVKTGGSEAASAWGHAITSQSGDSWVPFVMKLAVPANSQYIEAGIASSGLGSAEVRNVTVSIAPH